MNIWSLVAKRNEDLKPEEFPTGSVRFDTMLLRALPDLKSVTVCPEDFGADDIVIADNHLSLFVPPEIRTIVVHHGCAATHYERDLAWRNLKTQQMVELQRGMFKLPNRTYVAPSRWVGAQFCDQCPRGIDYAFSVIPHWVDSIEVLPKSGKPKIIGDWRDNNKGSRIWRLLASYCPQWEFQPLSFQDEVGRRKQYREASLYLCLSLSEGGSYSMCDAEAAGLPIVTTDVGNYREFKDCEVIPYDQRDGLGFVADAIERKLTNGRKQPSFYQDYTFEVWKQKWEQAIQ